MGARGPRSKTNLSVVESACTAIERPCPPSELTDEQKQEWVQITNRMPADWFPRETHGSLIQLCRARSRAVRLARIVEAMEEVGEDEFELKDYRDLLKSENEQSRTIYMLETKLRLTPHMQYHKSKKKGSLVKPPWQTGG